MGQILISFNLAALPMSIGPMVETFNTPPTTVGTAIVVNALFVAAFIMLGARLGELFGPKRVFQAAAIVFGAAMAVMSVSPNASMTIAAQGLAGAAAAALLPTLVVLIAANYDGRQQTQALGLLGSAEAFAGLVGFLVTGVLGTLLSWRYAFALLVPLAVAVFVLSGRLKPVERRSGVKIDAVGVALAAAAITLLTLGFNNINAWGLMLADRTAPFHIFGLSPAPVMILGGVVLAQAFFAWSRHREAAQKAPLLALEVIDSREERSAVLTLFVIVALAVSINFLVPLYIMIVQGRTSLQTGVAMMPYNLTIFVAAVLVVRVQALLPPRRIARYALALVAAGMAWLAFVIRNDWSTLPVILGLIAVGLGQGALVTVLFTVLVTASPRELAGDVGSLRGTTASLAAGVGTAFAAALAVGLLSSIVMRDLVDNPDIPPALKAQVDLDHINFVSNDRLLAELARTTATPEQKIAAVRINTASRLQALRISFLVLCGLALLAIFPAGGLSSRVRVELRGRSAP